MTFICRSYPKCRLDLCHVALSSPFMRVSFLRSQFLQIRKIIFGFVVYMQPSTPRPPPLSCTHIPHGPLFFFFLQPLLPTSLPPPPHFTFLAPPLSSASSSFCLLRWRKKKAPSRSLQQFRMAFISRYIAPSSSSAPLRRQRASKVLRYCHLQFSFYLRFFNSATPRGAVHTTWATSFVCLFFFCHFSYLVFTFKTFLFIFTLFFFNVSAVLKLQSYMSRTRDHHRRRLHPLDPLD